MLRRKKQVLGGGDDRKFYSRMFLTLIMLILDLMSPIRLTRLHFIDPILLRPGVSQKYQIAFFGTWSVGRLAWPMSLVPIANGIDGSNLPSACPPNCVEAFP